MRISGFYQSVHFMREVGKTKGKTRKQVEAEMESQRPRRFRKNKKAMGQEGQAFRKSDEAKGSAAKAALPADTAPKLIIIRRRRDD